MKTANGNRALPPNTRLVGLLVFWKTKAAIAGMNTASTALFWLAAIRSNDLWPFCAPAGAITAMMAGIYAGAAVRKFLKLNNKSA